MHPKTALSYLIENWEEFDPMPPQWLFTQAPSETLKNLTLPVDPEFDLKARTNEEWMDLIAKAETPREGAEMLFGWILDTSQAIERERKPDRDEPD